MNLAVMAVLGEYGGPLEERFGQFAPLAITWGTALVSVIVAAALAPMASDNRPRLARPLDAQPLPPMV